MNILENFRASQTDFQSVHYYCIIVYLLRCVTGLPRRFGPSLFTSLYILVFCLPTESPVAAAAASEIRLGQTWNRNSGPRWTLALCWPYLACSTECPSGYLVLDFPKNLDVDSLLNGKLSFWFILSILSLNDRGLTGHCSQLQCFLDVTETMICKI